MAGLAAAQTPIPARLTLDDALKIAAERNPRFAAARNVVEAVEADRLGASVRPNPAVTVSSEGYPIGQLAGHRCGMGRNSPFASTRKSRPAGRRDLRSEATGRGVDHAHAELRDQLRQLELEVQSRLFSGGSGGSGPRRRDRRLG